MFEPISDSEWADLPVSQCSKTQFFKTLQNIMYILSYFQTIDNYLREDSTNDQIGRGDVDMVSSLKQFSQNGLFLLSYSPVFILILQEPPAKRTRYQCETCDKTFSRSDNFKRHQRLHVQEDKPFACHRCAKKFRRASDLKRHEKVHEKRAVEREYRCGTCGKEFRNAGPYRAHIKSTHPRKRKSPRNDHQGKFKTLRTSIIPRNMPIQQKFNFFFLFIL